MKASSKKSVLSKNLEILTFQINTLRDHLNEVATDCETEAEISYRLNASKKMDNLIVKYMKVLSKLKIS